VTTNAPAPSITRPVRPATSQSRPICARDSVEGEQRYTRLSVNVAFDVAEAVRALCKRRGITATEGVRRAIALWKIAEDATAKGQQVQIVDPVTGSVRELVLV